MKITLNLDDTLIEEAQCLAARDQTTLRALIEEGLRRVVNERKWTTGFRLKDASFRGEGLQPGVQEGSWEQLRRLVYESHGS